MTDIRSHITIAAGLVTAIVSAALAIFAGPSVAYGAETPVVDAALVDGAGIGVDGLALYEVTNAGASRGVLDLTLVTDGGAADVEVFVARPTADGCATRPAAPLASGSLDDLGGVLPSSGMTLAPGEAACVWSVTVADAPTDAVLRVSLTLA